MIPTINTLKRTAVVVDDFLANPDALRRFALGLEYRADNRYFRGQRSTTRHLWPGLREAIEQLLGLRVDKDLWEAHGTNGVFQFCIGGDQLVYHSDQNTHAATLYLTPDPPACAGTTLYKSRRHNGRTVQEVIARYEKTGFRPDAKTVEREMYENKLLDRTAWEVVDVFGNVYNRLVVWDAKLVHAASDYFGHSKETGRLFQMLFFDAR